MTKSPTQLDAEITEALAARRSASKLRNVPKRDPKIVVIEGEPWRVERERFWLPNTGEARWTARACGTVFLPGLGHGTERQQVRAQHAKHLVNVAWMESLPK